MAAPSIPVISRRERRLGGCCEAAVEPDLGRADALDLAAKFKAISDPTRLRIVDALRKAAPQAICQCEFSPLFEISQQALSKHLKVLRSAGLIGSEHRGLWTYYYVESGGLDDIRGWLA